MDLPDTLSELESRKETLEQGLRTAIGKAADVLEKDLRRVQRKIEDVRVGSRAEPKRWPDRAAPDHKTTLPCLTTFQPL